MDGEGIGSRIDLDRLVCKFEIVPNIGAVDFRKSHMIILSDDEIDQIIIKLKESENFLEWKNVIIGGKEK